MDKLNENLLRKLRKAIDPEVKRYMSVLDGYIVFRDFVIYGKADEYFCLVSKKDLKMRTKWKKYFESSSFNVLENRFLRVKIKDKEEKIFSYDFLDHLSTGDYLKAEPILIGEEYFFLIASL